MVINHRRSPGVPCSGSCGSWYHISCCETPIPEELISDILIGSNPWLCDSCKISNRSKSTNASLVSGPQDNCNDPNDLSNKSVSGGGAEELSWGAVYARLDRLEGRIRALWEENVNLRTELAECKAFRSDIKALEYRLDAITFWGATPGRPSTAGPSKPLPGGSLAASCLGDFSGPYSTSSPVSKRADAASKVHYRDIFCGGLGSPAVGRRLSVLPAASPAGGAVPATGGSTVVSSAGAAGVSATIVPGPTGFGLGSSGAALALAPVPTALAPVMSVPDLETIEEVSSPIPGPSSIGAPNGIPAADGGGCVPGVRDGAGNGGATRRGDCDGRDREEARRAHRAENKKRPLILGSSVSCPFSAVPLRGTTSDGRNRPDLAQLFVTRLALNVTVDCVRDYLSSLGYNSRVVQLRPPRKVTSVTYNSFRISIPRESLGNLLCPDVWPPGAGVKEWFFRAPSATRD